MLKYNNISNMKELRDDIDHTRLKISFKIPDYLLIMKNKNLSTVLTETHLDEVFVLLLSQTPQ